MTRIKKWADLLADVLRLAAGGAHFLERQLAAAVSPGKATEAW